MPTIQDQRLFFSDNGVLSDLSVLLNDYRSETATVNIVAAEDYLYLGSFLPLNHKFFKVSSANALASVVSVDVWTGQGSNTGWKAAVEVIDRTAVAGASLAQSGIISFTTDRDENWHREQDSFDVTGLENTEIYDMYWMRMKWSADVTGTTALQHIGQKFNDDDDLYAYYPDLNKQSLRTAFDNSSKTDWEEQEFDAATAINRDMRRRGYIFTADQILDWEIFIEPSVHKTAELIFQGLGSSYVDLRDRARRQYLETLEQGFMRLDLTQDGRLQLDERGFRQGRLVR